MSAVTPLPNGQSRSDSYVMRVRRSQSLLVTECVRRIVYFFQAVYVSLDGKQQFPNFQS